MKYLNFASYLLSGTTIVLISILNLNDLLFSYVLFGFILYILVQKMFDDKTTKKIAILAYAYTSFIGVLLVWLHYEQFNMPFDVFGDDKRFFEWAQYYKDNLLSHSYSVYEKVLALLLRLFGSIGFKDNPELLLPLNWMILSLTIGLSYKLTLLVTKIRIPLYLFFLSIFLNYTFIQNSVHLYRDIYVSFFTILTIVYTLEKQYIKAILSSFGAGLFRLPNAIFALMIVGSKFFLDKKKTKFIIGIIFSSFIILAFIGMVKMNLHIGKYNLGNITSAVDTRITTYIENIQEQSGGTAMLKKLPMIVQFPLNIPVQVIRPIKIENYFKPLRERYSQLKLLNHRSLGWSITVLSMIILVGYYIRGLFLSVFINTPNVRLFIFSFILLATVLGFLSFLDRNRVFLIPLFPTLIALNFMNYKLSTIQNVIMKNLNKMILSVLFLLIATFASIQGVY